ncbi:hypothetical protein R3P38DRAFT_3366987 [Favolaschia claudopus]|uniref:Uncharacterized protein n=1 Tax=Favolaschia claudopus TaxID=2862362 RepID=A0AAW0ACA0_9AGAR
MSSHLNQTSTSFEASRYGSNSFRPVWHIQSNGTAICRICDDGRERALKNCSAHEKTSAHQSLLDHRTQQAASEPQIMDDALRNLLSAFTGNTVDPYPTQRVPSPNLGISWNLAMDDTEIPLSAEEQGVAAIASAILHRYDDLPASDDEFEERSEDGYPPDPSSEPSATEAPLRQDESIGGPPRKCPRTEEDEGATARFWFPWRDRITCTLDILMHLPRSVFSQRQLDLFLWLLKVNEVDNVPSVKSMQTLNAALQKMCGIDSIMYNGALGHKYYVNSLPQIIAQEMANPKVRPHLSFYPEDSGPKLSEARQGDRWLKELPDNQTTPMVRIAQQDYFIHEPAMLRNGECCIPTRWFTKSGQLFANCWQLQPIVTDAGVGWRVFITSEPLVVAATEFLKNFPELRVDVESGFYDKPNPANIFGKYMTVLQILRFNSDIVVDVYDEATQTTSEWTYTNPKVGNRWRAKAEGCRVVMFPLWMYCDDTSGNVSKKWNEHNSFLVTPAGLPREESQKEYNIHFLSTSNIAPPLEMLDGIVEQLECVYYFFTIFIRSSDAISEAQENGIWAWDSVLNEPVLVIPEVLALLGDNPMQSEFACHIGLRGKLFYRACWVKGSDAAEQDVEPASTQPAGGGASDAESVGGSDRGSADGSADNSEAEAGTAKKKGKGKRKVQESLTQMVQRVTSFMKIDRLRNKTETTEKLKSYFVEASYLDSKTKIQKQRTETGVKDTYQLHFLEKIFESYKGKRGRASKEAALNARLASLPQNTTSPVWRIKGLDPHQDTPVEILHVILLGFVKYLWRDVVQNHLKNKDALKELLITRLTSLDVSGLGISPLAGKTLVQYSGSLTGRDFRAIAQVAPFVLYDLVPSACFETWQSLSKMIPLIWQPEIVDRESHLLGGLIVGSTGVYGEIVYHILKKESGVWYIPLTLNGRQRPYPRPPLARGSRHDGAFVGAPKERVAVLCAPLRAPPKWDSAAAGLLFLDRNIAGKWG